MNNKRSRLHYRLLVISDVTLLRICVPLSPLLRSALLHSVLKLNTLRQNARLRTARSLTSIVIRHNITTRNHSRLIRHLLHHTHCPRLQLTSNVRPLRRQLRLRRQLAILTSRLARLISRRRRAMILIALTSSVLLRLLYRNIRQRIRVVPLSVLTSSVCQRAKVRLIDRIRHRIWFQANGRKRIPLPIVTAAARWYLRLIMLTVSVRHLLRILHWNRTRHIRPSRNIRLIPRSNHRHGKQTIVNIIGVASIRRPRLRLYALDMPLAWTL